MGKLTPAPPMMPTMTVMQRMTSMVESAEKAVNEAADHPCCNTAERACKAGRNRPGPAIGIARGGDLRARGIDQTDRRDEAITVLGYRLDEAGTCCIVSELAAESLDALG